MQLSPRATAGISALLVASSLLLTSVARADLLVPAGGSVSLAAGTLDLGCSDIVIGGTLQVNSGTVINVRNVTIQAGGVIDGGVGTITLAGNWSNSGSFVPGTSTVSFVDNAACAPSSTISGSTTFYNLSLVSSSGKIYAFQAGSSQIVLNLLTITGVAGTPIKITSTVPGVQATLNLAPGGSQNIAHVGVIDNWAIGQPLAPGQGNEGGGANVRGWFGLPLNAAIPALDVGNLLLLMLVLGAMGMTAVARVRPKSNP
jgi:hypothetical protein